MLPFIGLLIGILLGLALNIPVPLTYSKYLGIAVLAALDTAIGGLRASLEMKFNEKLFFTGFFSNTLMAVFFVWIGDRLGVDLYLAAVVAFGVRLFQNMALVRRHYFQKRHWE